MSDFPFLTVITVTKDNCSGLKKTYGSLSNQRRFHLMEWIVIDGASNDGTAEFLVSLQAADVRPSFWSSLPDGGIYDAMNKGLVKALGQYVLFLNAGDTLADDYTVDFLEQAIKCHFADFVYGDSFEMVREGRVYKKPARSHERKEIGMFTHHQAMLYKRALIGGLSYDTRWRIAADYDFTLRFLEKAEGVHYLPEPVCVYESGGMSQKYATLGRRELFEIRRVYRLVPYWRNVMIFYQQFFAHQLRRFAPALYWRLKQKS